jgi:starch-binding outer membrane protein, SusD/RagB family
MKNRIIFFTLLSLVLLTISCKDELSEASNKNEPTEAALKTESGLIALAKGGTYFNGVANFYSSVDDGLGFREGKNLGYLTSMIFGLHEAMGDVIFVPWGNQSFKFADNPTDITLDDNAVIPMPIGKSQPFELKLRNDRAYGPGNTFLMEWTQMYFLNNAMNVLLANIDEATYIGDGENKKRTLKAWGYFWKGYAYSRIGSIYVAGLVIDEPNSTNGDFVTNAEMINEANANFDLATDQLEAVDDLSVFNAVLSIVIPGYCQTGKGGVPTPVEWIRNINTMKARNLAANKKVDEMTSGDWTALQTLTEAGILNSDPVFVIKTTDNFNTSVIDPNVGNVASYSATENDQYFYISERLIQDFRAGDKRFDNNFELMESPLVDIRGRGLAFGTRWYLVDGGKGIGNAISYVHTGEYGVDDIYLAGSFEENELLKAEALIHNNDIAGGTAIIDAIRTLQGAELAAIGTVTKEEALEELRSERRIALLFRGLAFYDARRMGITDDKSKGGGREGAVVLSYDNNDELLINTNAFINYNYLPYFDVPQNELEFNQATAGSANTSGPE